MSWAKVQAGAREKARTMAAIRMFISQLL